MEEINLIKKDLWLDHLVHATPVEGYGNRMSMFLISLEAWRRGIDVKYYTIDNPENKVLIRFALTHNGRTLNFYSSLCEQMSKEAFDICESKYLTKKQLSANGIRVPKGEKFSKDADKDHLVSLAAELNYPVVMKPVSENAGKGVFSNITNKNMLLKTFNYLTNELGYHEVLLEEFIEGEEHRILTVGDKVVGIVKRVPANIVGNGKDSIRRLIRAKNKSKQFNPVIAKKTIDIDRELKSQIEHAGYGLDDILEEGKKLFVRSKSNISTGGDPIDVMDDVDPSVIEMAEKAAQAIPGLEVSGLDMMINPETQEKVIIEINTRPMIGLHVFPEGGKPRDIVKEIVDYYFPETKNIERSRLYFDFGRITASLDGVATKEIALQSITPQTYHAKRYLLSIDGNNHKLRRDIRRHALVDDIYGYAKGAGFNLLEVVLASPIKEKINSFFSLHYQDSEFRFEIIEEQDWNYAVNVGFITGSYSDNINLLERSIKESKKKTERLIKTHQQKVEQLTEQLNESKEKTTVYKKAFSKLEQQNKDLKSKQRDYQNKVLKQKEEIEMLKIELNRTLYRRLFKSKRTK